MVQKEFLQPLRPHLRQQRCTSATAPIRTLIAGSLAAPGEVEADPDLEPDTLAPYLAG